MSVGVALIQTKVCALIKELIFKALHCHSIYSFLTLHLGKFHLLFDAVSDSALFILHDLLLTHCCLVVGGMY